MPIVPISKSEGTAHINVCLIHLLIGLLQCIVQGAAFEKHLEASSMQWHGQYWPHDVLFMKHCTGSQWASQLQFKMLVVTFKALHGMGLGYL